MNVVKIIMFDHAYNLEEVEMSDNITEIGNYAFMSCEKLKKINLSSSLATIGKGAFIYSGLEEIEIPSTVNNIGNNAFQFCRALEEIRIKKTEREISGMDNFWFAPNVTQITWID